MPTADVPARDDTVLIRAFLAERDVACPGCGYNLRGVPSTRCPECEREVTLCVEGGWARPRQRTEAVVLLWIILLAGIGNLGIWVLDAGLSWLSQVSAWIAFATVVSLVCAVAEIAVTLLLILALRRPRGAADLAAALKWALIWLVLHAASVCVSLVSSIAYQLQ